jgi:hypothetical protein
MDTHQNRTWYMKNIFHRRFIFHPLTVLIIALIAAFIFALFINLLFDGELRWFLLYYFTPIGIPFVVFLFDRAERRAFASKAAWKIDAIILGLSLIRSVILIPIVSGHALFLTYALLTSQSKLARITALLVLVEVAYLKIFIWRDPTLIGGILVGCLTALLYKRIGFSKQAVLSEA